MLRWLPTQGCTPQTRCPAPRGGGEAQRARPRRQARICPGSPTKAPSSCPWKRGDRSKGKSQQITRTGDPARGKPSSETAPAPGLDPAARRPNPPPLPECHPALLTPRSSSERKSGPSSEPSCWAQRGEGGGASRGQARAKAGEREEGRMGERQSAQVSDRPKAPAQPLPPPRPPGHPPSWLLAALPPPALPARPPAAQRRGGAARGGGAAAPLARERWVRAARSPPAPPPLPCGRCGGGGGRPVVGSGVRRQSVGGLSQCLRLSPLWLTRCWPSSLPHAASCAWFADGSVALFTRAEFRRMRRDRGSKISGSRQCCLPHP